MRVILIAVTTICGRISPAKGLGSLTDRGYLEHMREMTGASLIGAGTLREGDPEMRIKDGKIPSNRVRSIITLSGNLPHEGKAIFNHEPHPFIFSPTDKVSYLQKQLGKKATIIGLNFEKDGLSLKELLVTLKSFGVYSLLIEGGGKLNYSALSQGIVDEVHLTIAPKASGDSNEKGLIEGSSPLGFPFLNLELYSHEVWKTGEVNLKYRITKKVLH
jgi:riboflavin biosynthesis pyrimidine reductase